MDSFVACKNLFCSVVYGNQVNDKYIKNVSTIEQRIKLPKRQSLDTVHVTKDWNGVVSISSSKETMVMNTKLM